VLHFTADRGHQRVHDRCRCSASPSPVEDYEVFLLSRIKEEVDLGESNDDAVAHRPSSGPGAS